VHVSDEAASIMLARHFGDFVAAARELGVARKDLRKLTWHNPRILKASHERMELFRIGVKSKIIEAVYSPSAKRRRWGYDALCDSYEFRDSLFAGAGLLAPAPCERSAPVAPVVDAQLVLEQEAAVELERERDAELEGDRRREQEGDEMRAPPLSGWCDIDPVSEVSEVLDTSASVPPTEPAPAASGLPAWTGRFGPPPLVAHLYRPWTPPRQEPCRRVARSG
jgi:hypothetical protein